MRPQIVNDSMILILLNKDDLTALHLEPVKIDFSDENTRNILLSLLEQVQVQTGKQLKSGGKTVVEILPFENGDCLICFSKAPLDMPKIKITARIKHCTRVYEFSTLNDVKQYLNAAPSADKREIYERDGTYRIIMTNPQKKDVLLIAEFGRELKYNLAQYYTKEHFSKTKI